MTNDCSASDVEWGSEYLNEVAPDDDQSMYTLMYKTGSRKRENIQLPHHGSPATMYVITVSTSSCGVCTWTTGLIFCEDI